jgi:hypothetical protein
MIMSCYLITLSLSDVDDCFGGKKVLIETSTSKSSKPFLIWQVQPTFPLQTKQIFTFDLNCFGDFFGIEKVNFRLNYS